MNTVLFACVHNAGRSQMAAAWFNLLSDPAKARAISAGTDPGPHVHPEVVAAMDEVGVDLSGAATAKLTTELAQHARMLITMGCGDQCPVVPGVERDDWPLADPKGKPLEEVRRIRDEIRDRVTRLVDTQGWRRTTSASRGRQTLRMPDYAIRTATPDDLEALTTIYNHYIANSAITFDLHPFTAAERRAWFDDHSDSGPHRLLVAADEHGTCVGYSSSSRWRAKPAYSTTVEVSVYCHPNACGRGCGSALYRALFAALEQEDVTMLVAGVSLPNPASIALHERFGFRRVGVFHSVGRKFERFWDVAWFERPVRLDSPEAPVQP